MKRSCWSGQTKQGAGVYEGDALRTRMVVSSCGPRARAGQRASHAKPPAPAPPGFGERSVPLGNLGSSLLPGAVGAGGAAGQVGQGGRWAVGRRAKTDRRRWNSGPKGARGALVLCKELMFAGA